jgi:Fe-S-cluster containining protein
MTDDCEGCYGLCCAVYDQIYLTKLDIIRIAKHLELTTNEFTERYTIECVPLSRTGKRLYKMRERKTHCFKFSKPCIFWTQGLCGIHDVRPVGCAEWTSKKIENDSGISCKRYHNRLFKGRVMY